MLTKSGFCIGQNMLILPASNSFIWHWLVMVVELLKPNFTLPSLHLISLHVSFWFPISINSLILLLANHRTSKPIILLYFLNSSNSLDSTKIPRQHTTSLNIIIIHMASFVPFGRLALVLAMFMVITGAPAYAQISTPCNVSVLSTFFTPCMNFLTSSSANGTSPTTQCCSALKSLTSGGMDCLCLIVTGSVPFRIPFNRSLAISLPRACNMPGVPVQCKGKFSSISFLLVLY